MLYNDSISYNQPGVSFLGSVTISVPGLSLPILIGNINVFFSQEIDYSNSTNIGIVTVNYAPSAIVYLENDYSSSSALVSYSISRTDATAQISIETDIQTANAIANASSISIDSYSDISINY
jgi:hypothetical protein